MNKEKKLQELKSKENKQATSKIIIAITVAANIQIIRELYCLSPIYIQILGIYFAYSPLK